MVDTMDTEDPAYRVYQLQRSVVLDGNPDLLGLAPTTKLPNVWGALVEFGSASEILTLFALGDGSTFFCTSSGKDMIGGGIYASVSFVTTLFLEAVEKDLQLLGSVESAPPPGPGRVRFHALTYDGILSGDAAAADLIDESHPFRPLFMSGHQVITQLREVAGSDTPARTPEDELRAAAAQEGPVGEKGPN